MNNNALIANSIRKELSDQREKLSVLEKQADEINATIETHKIMIDGLERSLDQYQSINQAENNSIHENSASTIANSQHGSLIPTLCKEYTLQILEKSKVPMHGNEIAAVYENTGVTNSNISTYGKAVRKHLEELEKEGLIYKTNPGAQRSIRFAPISKITVDDI